jgi:hypothetical protein
LVLPDNFEMYDRIWHLFSPFVLILEEMNGVLRLQLKQNKAHSCK